MRAMVASLAIACVVAGCDSPGLWSAPREHQDGTNAAGGTTLGSSTSSGNGHSSTTTGTTTSNTTTGTNDTSGSGSTTGTTSSTTTSSTGTTGVVTSAEVDVMGTANNLGSSNTSTYDLAISPNGTLYASDTGDDAILTFPAGNATVFAGGTGNGEHQDGNGTSAELAYPYGMVFVGNTLYVMDSGDGSEYSYLRSVDSSANVGSVCGDGIDENAVNGVCSAAQFSQPKGIAVDTAGNIYVADSGANAIRRIEHDFSSVSTWAGSGTAGFVNAQGLQASFNSPIAVAVDANENVFVADYDNSAIRKIDANQNVTTFAVDSDPGAMLFGVAVDSAGNVYASDENNGGKILRWSPDGTLTAKITNASISAPACMKIGPDGNLWVADLSNGILRVTF